MNPLNPSAVVCQAEESEEQVVELAKAAAAQEGHCKWEFGRLAHKWTQKYAKGRTDADLAELVGGLTRSQVTQRRLVYAAVGDVCYSSNKLSWTHYRDALDWDDAEEWLAKADENGWSVARMKQERTEAYAQLEADDDADEAGNDTLEAAIAKPSSKAKPKRSRPQEQPELSSEQLQTALLARADSIVRYTIPKLVQTAKAIDKFLTERESPGVDIASLTYQQKVDIAGMLRHQEELTLIFNDARAAVSPPKKEVLQ